MTMAILVNLATILCCLAVLVQSLRLMRRLRTMRDGSLHEMVGALDAATSAARAVLHEMKRTLAEGDASQRDTLARAESVRDELVVLIGIGNSVADRLAEAGTGAAAAGAEP